VQQLNKYIETNRQAFVDDLSELLRIASVSADPRHASDIGRAAQWVAVQFNRLGLPTEMIKTAGHPLVYAETPPVPGKPVALVYGHYDVQPPDPLDEWISPPFEPTVRNGNLYARGSADDKGQVYSQIKAVEALRAVNGTLPVNLKFLVEGEEETGGESIGQFVAVNPAKLEAVVALVSVTELYAEGIPTLCIGLRGLIYTEIEARGPARDLHSGMYGGAAPNAIFGLVELLSQLKDANGHIQIPGMYDDVRPPSHEEKHSWSTLPFDESEFLKNEVGSKCLTGEPGYSVFERTWARPTLEVHGIVGGYTAPGAKTVIPAKATAKVSMRIVPDQDPEKIVRLYKKFVQENTPAGVETDVRVLSLGPAIMVNPDHPAIKIAAKACSEIFGRETVFIRSGGSIPIVGDFATHLKIPTILMGFGLPDDGLHSPNEKYKIANYYTGIMTIAHFLEQYGG